MYFWLCCALAWSCCSCVVNMSCYFQSFCFCLGLQVMKKAHVARQRLLRLGIFKDVEVLIDTSEGNISEMWLHGVFVLLNIMAAYNGCLAGVNMQKLSFFTMFGSPSSGTDALPNGLDVTFEVTEVKRLTGSYNTMVGNNEGSMVREMCT